jgi:uncharacterized membrane protein (DUF4010 family)
MPELEAEAMNLWRLAVALAVGLVIGSEREQRKGEGPARAAAGIRTFTLVGLMGGVASLFGLPMAVTCGVFVGGVALVSHALSDRSDPGITTEVALVLTYALGALAITKPAVAFAAAICAALVLATRNDLHTFLHKHLTDRELRDALVLGASALVILPLVPNRFIGPMSVVNPQTLWKLVVVMMAITAAGYVAQRTIGSTLGLAIAGFAGGFVSSAATISAMGARAKQDDSIHAAAVAGATSSTVATFIQLVIVVSLANPAMVPALLWPLGCGGAAAAAYSLFRALKAAKTTTAVAPQGHAFSLKSALLFALLVATVGIISAFAESRFGQAAVPIAAALAGLADAHASAASAASLNAAGRASESLALFAILIAFTTNSCTKSVLAFSSGTRRFGLQVGIGQLLVLACAWGGFAVRSAL